MVVATPTSDPINGFKLALEKAMKQIEGKVENLPKVATSICRSQRAELFKELYGYYERCYKKNTWADYRSWLARNRYKHSQARTEEFKKSKDFRKPIEISSFCSYWLGFLKTEDLYYLISIARDKENRGENFNKWLFWAIKKQ